MGSKGGRRKARQAREPFGVRAGKTQPNEEAVWATVPQAAAEGRKNEYDQRTLHCTGGQSFSGCVIRRTHRDLVQIPIWRRVQGWRVRSCGKTGGVSECEWVVGSYFVVSLSLLLVVEDARMSWEGMSGTAWYCVERGLLSPCPPGILRPWQPESPGIATLGYRLVASVPSVRPSHATVSGP